jgi:hypothetical protein
MQIKYLRIARRDLVYFKFIQEAHEGLTTLSTMDAASGIVRLTYFGDATADVEAMLADLAKAITIEELPEWEPPVPEKREG